MFTAVFLVVALWPLWSGESPRAWAIVAAAALAVCSWLAPAALAPLNRVWFRLGELLHRVVSPIALGVVFYIYTLF